MYEKYEIDDKILIGNGKTGNVYRATSKNIQEIKAINIIDK